MEFALKKMLATLFGTIQDIVDGCGEGENKLISLNKVGARTLMNPVETISTESTVGKQADAHPLHIYPCYWPKMCYQNHTRSGCIPQKTLHLAMSLCPTVKHTLQGVQTHTHFK